MQLSSDEVKRLAALARLKLSDADTEAMRSEISAIFQLIEQMSAIDTTGVAPMSHAQDVVQRLREDLITERDQHEHLQQGAPAVENALYLVPKVIE